MEQGRRLPKAGPVYAQCMCVFLTARYKAVHYNYSWNKYLNLTLAVPAPTVAAESGLEDRLGRHAARHRDELHRTTSHSHVTTRTCYYDNIPRRRRRRRRRTIVGDTTTISRRTTRQRTTVRV